MGKKFIQKTIVDMEYDEYNGYKTKLLKGKDLDPCICFTPKAFKEYKENNSVEVVGTVKINQRKYRDTANEGSTIPDRKKAFFLSSLLATMCSKSNLKECFLQARLQIYIRLTIQAKPIQKAFL